MKATRCGASLVKQGFGGELTPWIGAWDFPTNRTAHWGYAVAMPKVWTHATKAYLKLTDGFWIRAVQVFSAGKPSFSRTNIRTRST